MSVQGKVGPWEFVWKSIPRGPQGTAQVEVRARGAGSGEILDIRWRRDGDGLWLELPSGVHGFDLESELDEDGKPLLRVAERGGPQFWQGLSYLRAGEEQVANAAAGVKKNARVRAQMPGKILRIHVKEGDTVEKGQSIIVMEAMKMENEIKAPQSGRVETLQVTEGQAVETGAELCTIK